jgi:hypothetical protein
MLALGAPILIVLAALLLFAASVVVVYTFSLVRHAKTLVADTKRAAERLSEAAQEVEAEVKAMEEASADLQSTRGARGSTRRRGV